MSISISQLKQIINETHKHAEKLKAEIAVGEKSHNPVVKLRVRGKKDLLAGLEALNRRRYRELDEKEHKPVPTPKPKPKPRFTMYDAVEISAIPDNPEAVAGYVNWTFDAVVKRFPKAKHLSITGNADLDAMCLDIETGDATPAQAPSWVRRQHARGEKTPWVYVEASRLWEVLNTLSRDDIKRNEYRIWVADWTGVPHIPVGCDACQWRGEVGVRPQVYDESLCEGYLL